LVGGVASTNAEEVRQIAREFYHGMKAGNGWTELPRSERLAVLYRAADRLWYERQRLAALIVFEAGKSWGEALADVDEAIDFVNFYAKEELRWTQELKDTQPRGVTAVIAPWNFPLAIPCGMAVAPLAAGNPVILKPAEQTPLIARELVEILHWAGVPKTALFFAPGDGESVGAPLVKSEHVSTIVFTGSKAVGQWIYQTASVQQVHHPLSGTAMFKRVITEMGGKNAIVVTNNCEQDETVSGILYAAFAHAGQKCSACSRVLVDEEVKASLMERLVRAVNDLEVGVATAPHVLVNPLVTKEDQERVRAIVREAVQEAEAYGGKV
jgi:RHH-type proline utilization regulon transcriptional repressor/proline dehydrogenase/delta 1-pyrroline-5-carboxylate dehydrogenase